MAGRLQDKVCLITGSGGSMGRAAALLFAAEGAKIVGCDIHAQSASDTCAEVRTRGGEMVSMEPCDLTQAADAATLVETALDSFGRVDVLFNNAAMAYFSWIDRIESREWLDTINEELNIVFHLTRACWPALTRQGGVIINTASIAAHQSMRGHPSLAHCAAKGGVLAMTRQLALEGAPHGVRAVSISPGLIETKQTAPLLANADATRAAVDGIMLGRPGRPDEIANLALFLASDESSYITGTDIRIDGGLSAW